jgi:two-component system nitrogen regulation sensor histidine kinase NtrY
MVYRRYYISIIVRVILLFLTNLVIAYLVVNTKLYYNILVVTSLLILQVYLLISYFNRTNRLLERFFVSIKEGDYTTNFSNPLSKTPYNKLGNLADDIVKIISSTKIEEQYHYQYLGYIFEHIPIGLISIGNDGKIELCNSAFRNLFVLNKPQHINEISRIIPLLSDKILTLEPGRQLIEKYSYSGRIEYLSIKCSLFKIGVDEKKLVSFQSIKQELESSEIESWQKLTRILSHEIMNSVSPIISISKHLKEQFLKKTEVPESNKNEITLSETIDGLKLIEERSTGLKEFLSKYRSLTLDIKLNLELFEVEGLAEEMALFFHEQLKESKISYTYNISPVGLAISADRKLMTQVIINLIKNSIESLTNTEKGTIQFNSFLDENKRTCIQITDNGSGIPSEELENIFIPFYTRKEGGSGIGLSFSRQIMKLHNGFIEVASEPQKQTIFTLII